MSPEPTIPTRFVVIPVHPFTPPTVIGKRTGYRRVANRAPSSWFA
jgi:hypothetical protein